jgi:ribosome-binding ATPase YchF (GTP1/OBG family)
LVERLGLVGLPNSGKSALFNALTGGSALVAPHPFSTTQTTVGVAQVPDSRVEALAKVSESRKIVHTTVEVVDIAGLVAGAATGEGLGNRFLGGIREVDALCLVLRAFEDSGVTGDSDPVAALGVLELELVLADLATVEGQIDKRRKVARTDPSTAGELAALEAALEALQAGVPVYRSQLSAEQRAALVPAFLLTNKPVLAVVNLGEDQVGSADELVKPVAAEMSAGAEASPGGLPGNAPLARSADASPGGWRGNGPLARSAEVLGVSVQLEAEAARLDPAERTELLEGLGLGEGALPRVARAAHHLLGRRTFLTTGEDESRAWTFRAGARAPECAGVIHSDLQRGFIRAEVIRWDELVELGSWNAAKSAGRLRVEGKDYEVADGDVLEIRFNV